MTLSLAVGQNTNVSQLPQNLVAWHSRDSGGGISGVTTVETGFIRIDGITVRNGYHYRVECSQVNLTASSATTAGVANLRFSTSGSATTASARLPYGGFLRTYQTQTSISFVTLLVGEYHASADGNLSVLLSIVRDASSPGTGTIGIFASAANPCPMFVYEEGLYPAVSGVDI